MKNFLIMFLILLIQSMAFSQELRIFDYNNKSTLADGDAVLISEADHDYYYTTWTNLKTNIGLSNLTISAKWTTTGIPEFNGANFVSGAHGRVTFDDSVKFNYLVTSSNQIHSNYFKPFGSTYSIVGAANEPFDNMYASIYTIVNPAGVDDALDTLRISYTAGMFHFNRPVLGTNFLATDSAAVNLGSKADPTDTVYTQGIAFNHHGAIIADINDAGGLASPPSDILFAGVVIKPIALMYRQTYNTNANTRSLDAKSQLCVLNPSAAGGSIDTLRVDGTLWNGVGNPFITLYNKSTETITVTDTGGAGFNYCIRAKSSIVMGRYESVTLMLDTNVTQWVVVSTYDPD